MGVGHGDEVICQSKTFSASANPIVYQGAIPVFVDSERETWNMCPVQLEIAIKDRISKGNKPKAIIPVHLYGMPYKVDEINAVALKYNIPIVEDSAESLGSYYKGINCGTFGDFSILSFNGNKIITTSGGGAIVTKTKEHKDKAVFLATQARDNAPHYLHSEIGYNYRMTNLQAAIGLAQVERADEILSKKRAIAKLYNDGLQDLPLEVQPHMTWAEPVNWMNCIVLEDGTLPRDKMQNELKKLGIDTRPFFEPIPHLDIYSDPGYFPISKKLSSRGINLPSSSKLKEDEISYIVSSIRNILI